MTASALKRPLLVVGAGTMGRGIAQVAAAAGIEARLFDVDGSAVASAIARIASSTEKRVSAGKMSAEKRQATLSNLRPTTDLAEAAQGIGFAVEAVPERMDLKVSVLRTIAQAAPDDAIMGSNTSSLSITDLGEQLGMGSRVIGTHFFNPPPAMPLLELVVGLHTSKATISTAESFAKTLGKTAIIVNDSPGFATSRLGVVIGAEAIRMLEAGVASVGDIDQAMELGYRHPMGPLKLTDLVGLDVRLMILEHLHREVGEQFRPPSLLRQMVRAGWLGKKSGRGFYTWTADGPIPTDPRSR